MASGKKRSRGDTPRGLFLGSDGALSTMVAGQHQESGAWFPRMVVNAAIEAIHLPSDPEAPANNFLAIVSDGLTALTTEQVRGLSLDQGFPSAVTNAKARLVTVAAKAEKTTIHGAMVYDLEQVAKNKVRKHAITPHLTLRFRLLS